MHRVGLHPQGERQFSTAKPHRTHHRRAEAREYNMSLLSGQNVQSESLDGMHILQRGVGVS